MLCCTRGIVRTINLRGLSSKNYLGIGILVQTRLLPFCQLCIKIDQILLRLEGIFDLIIRSGVELAVTLICVGIPPVRLLYRTIVHGSKPESSSGRYKASDSDDSSRFHVRNLVEDNTLFSIMQKDRTESYITQNNNRSHEEILIG